MNHFSDYSPLPDLPETFWAYLAAFIDGEGSIMLCQKKYPRIVVTNTHRATLAYFHDAIGIGSISQQDHSKKPAYVFLLAPNGCRLVLPKIIPYLIQKRRKGELLLRYLKLNTIEGNQSRPPEVRAEIESLRTQFLELAGRR